jgi:hypothetical protein
MPFASRREAALKLIKRVVVSDSRLVLELRLGALLSEASDPARAAAHRVTTPIELIRKTDGAIVLTGASDRTAATDPALAKSLVRGLLGSKS